MYIINTKATFAKLTSGDQDQSGTGKGKGTQKQIKDREGISAAFSLQPMPGAGCLLAAPSGTARGEVWGMPLSSYTIKPGEVRMQVQLGPEWLH